MGSATGLPVAQAALRRPQLWTAVLLVLSGSANAIDVDYEIGVAAHHSDNINLSEENPISETLLAPRVFFDATQVGRTLQLAARGNLEYRHYMDDTFDDEVRGRFAGSLNWKVIPERLDFLLQDYLSLQPIDELLQFSPDNQQQVNVFLAGPTLYARFNPVTRGQLDLRYIDSYAEESESFNSNRYTVAARLIRQTSVNQSLSLNVEASDVRFNETDDVSDYRRYDGYINSSTERKYLDLSLDLGYSRLELDDSVTLAGRDVTSSYPLARATLTWRMSPRSVLGTTVRYQLSDATQSLMTPLELDRPSFNDFRVLDSVASPDVFQERMARVRYTRTGDRAKFNVAPYYRRIRYVESLAEPQDRRGIVAGIDYRLTPRLTLSAYAAREDRDYVDIGREDKDLIGRIGMARTFGRHWSGRLDVQHMERDSTQVGSSYNENAVMLSFSYQR